MNGDTSFALHFWDYLAFLVFFLALSVIGYWAGRKERTGVTEYFLAGKRLPWYVVGGSFIASNISTEHFIGMIGVAIVYGICVAMSEWGNVLSFSLLIWFFIPFLLASQVFTIPEFLEKRFNPVLRQSFALVTIVSNIVAFLAAVLYGGALAIQKLFESELSRLTDLLPGAAAMSADEAQQLQLWISIVVLGGFIGELKDNLFVYIQTLYSFFAPPFAAVFLLGILWKRINAKGAVAAVFLGFLFGIVMKVYVEFDEAIQKTIAAIPLHPSWLEPYANQSIINWAVCVLICVAVSLCTTPPRSEQITDQLTFNWRKMNIFGALGAHWYTSVVTWWLVFVASIVTLLILFSGLVIPI